MPAAPSRYGVGVLGAAVIGFAVPGSYLGRRKRSRRDGGAGKTTIAFLFLNHARVYHKRNRNPLLGTQIYITIL
jgi:hypothetical protein